MAERFVENEPEARRRQRRALLLLGVFALLMLPVLVSLGIWQLNRAAEKTGQLRILNERIAQTPLHEEELALTDLDLEHRRVDLTGRYDPHYQWLLDNRTHQGRFGYEVITAFRLASSFQWVLVSRGWIAAPPRRDVLPELPVPAGPQRLQGQLDSIGGKPLVLRDLPPEIGWPKRIQYLDLERLEADAGHDFLPWLVRLDEQAPGVLVPTPRAAPMGPETHRGYAVQWFGLAAVLFIGTIAAFIKITRESP